jgi:hypothetical protein
MAVLKVVELRDVTAEGEQRILARFVEMQDGVIRRVDVTPSAAGSVDYLIGNGVFAGNRVVGLSAGYAFLEALSKRFTGSRLWATDILEMDEADAFRTR